MLADDGTVEVRPKKPALDRLGEVREPIAARPGAVDVEAIRRESKRAWGGLDDR